MVGIGAIGVVVVGGVAIGGGADETGLFVHISIAVVENVFNAVIEIAT